MELKPTYYNSVLILMSSVEILNNGNTAKILFDLHVNEMTDLFQIWIKCLFGKTT